MNGLRLLKRREILVPTLVGWLLLFVCVVAIVAAFTRLIHPFLAPHAPATGAMLLVVEGWLSTKALDQAIVVYRQGGYQQVITTGGPVVRRPGIDIDTNYAELAANYLQSHGLSGVQVTAVPAPASAQDRTYLSAVMVRNWVSEQGLEHNTIDLLSEGTHARRSLLLYRKAFGPDFEIGIRAAQPFGYDPERWWQTSTGAKAVLGETIGWLWTVCCFRPPPHGSHEELWEAPSRSR